MRYFAPIAAGVAQLVEHLICNQRVGGSSPFAGSMSHLKIAGVVEWLMAPGCKPGGFTPYGGSNPPPCTRESIADFQLPISNLMSGVLLSVIGNWKSAIGNNLGGCSSVGRASAFQAEGREFESRRPLQFSKHWDLRPRSSGVERLLGKEEVMSSNLIAGSSEYQPAHRMVTILI
jgi:hypothetical protein